MTAPGVAKLRADSGEEELSPCDQDIWFAVSRR